MLKVLLVDDDPDEFQLFSSALNSRNKPVSLMQKENCNQMLDTIRSWKPDLVFMDINMPGIDGIECLKLIRNEDDFISLPVIMYSTSRNRFNIEEAYNCKANLYVIKPFNFSEIAITLEKVITMDWKHIHQPDPSHFVVQ